MQSNHREFRQLAEVYGMTTTDLELVMPILAYYPSDWRKVIAAEMMPMLQEEARVCQTANLQQGVASPVPPKSAERGDARDIAAKAVGVGHSAVQQAVKVGIGEPA